MQSCPPKVQGQVGDTHKAIGSRGTMGVHRKRSFLEFFFFHFSKKVQVRQSWEGVCKVHRDTKRKTKEQHAQYKQASDHDVSRNKISDCGKLEKEVVVLQLRFNCNLPLKVLTPALDPKLPKSKHSFYVGHH